MQNENKKSFIHNIIMENREKMTISGVLDILTFDEDEITLETEMGLMIIKGTELKVEKLSIDTGEVVARGFFNSLCYSEEGVRKGGFFKNMFK